MINIIKSIITEAGKLIQKSSTNIVKKKGEAGNFATYADMKSEELIISSLCKHFPSHAILSEESYSKISFPQKEKNLWIIDPLDGTTNFKYNIPFYAISIAYMELGQILSAAIFDPLRNELFWGEKNKGCFLNNKKITMPQKLALNGIIINIGSPYNKVNFGLSYPLGEIFHDNGARIVNFGSSVLECAWTSIGRLGGYLEAGLKPWDIAAGQLLISEAGGVMIDPYDQKNKFSIFDQKSILIGNKEIINQLTELISKN